MVQIITPVIAFREKISDNWTVKLYNGSSYWDRVTQKAVDYNDFKKNWIETLNWVKLHTLKNINNVIKRNSLFYLHCLLVQISCQHQQL